MELWVVLLSMPIFQMSQPLDAQEAQVVCPLVFDPAGLSPGCLT